ncbi:uncharacterized protein BDR25DRAFT_217446 [Lindgomyces ingoldianus]|uniref:Uncharacterized protein n=1 Tax=Lindgomyces ingoldianus TaxID=673940 RepID=A0ACB6R589_9PLEO|nr:uncharacterized protein BDR25DRAFT_217446 [Lindgomyces ingoldianus]KAF2473950.1 hypothetical protein BDR25DRAFT_217446 [Lindgomyces ingoldianus]
MKKCTTQLTPTFLSSVSRSKPTTHRDPLHIPEKVQSSIIIVKRSAPLTTETSSPSHASNLLTCAYTTDLLGEVECAQKGVKTWVLRHAHVSRQFEKAQTRDCE